MSAYQRARQPPKLYVEVWRRSPSTVYTWTIGDYAESRSFSTRVEISDIEKGMFPNRWKLKLYEANRVFWRGVQLESPVLFAYCVELGWTSYS